MLSTAESISRRSECSYFYSREMLYLKRDKFLIFAMIIPIFCLPALLRVDSARAADCASKACIDVYVQDGQIIIEGHKGTGSSARPKVPRKSVPKPRVKPVPKPKPVPRPTVRISPSVKAPVRKVPRKTIPRRVMRKVAPTLSLNDRLIKLLPTGNISKQPSADAVVNIPIIYWCDLPSVFNTKVAVVGEVIDVTMRPAFLWSFGDGSFYATTSPGGPYPNQRISHTYTHAGTYAVVMLATWGGTWTHNGVARAVTGEIRKASLVTVSVAVAPTRITN